LPPAARRLQGAEGRRFGELPKTSTGKIQKFELRNAVGSDKAIDLAGDK
jgi:fatty-acyl-CoA synthase